MSALLAQQQALLAHKLQVLARLEADLKWSLERLPELMSLVKQELGGMVAAIARFDHLCRTSGLVE